MKQLMAVLPYFLLAFLVGVFIASIATPPEWFVMFLAVSAAIISILTFFIKRKALPLLLFVILGLLIGMLRFGIWQDAAVDPILSAHTGELATFEGVISDEPDVREGGTHLTVSLVLRNIGSTSAEVSGTALVMTNRFPEYHYGDRVTLSGKLALPQKLTEDDGRVFDYPAYLRAKGINYQMLFPKLTLISTDNGNPLLASLFKIKLRFETAIASALPSPESALLSGLLLGGKQSLGTLWLERFRTAGIIHIVVLSGYNMTVVAQWLVVLFRSFGFYGSLSAGAVGIVLFALMTGGGATVLRAAIMALFVLLAKLTGRSYDMGRALLLAAALMVLQNPSILLFDPSFQLSFLASIGLIFASPMIEKRTSLFRSIPILREVFVSTLATQLVVLPLLIYQTGMISLVSLPANLLVLPFIPLTMLLGFVAGVFALILPTLGMLLGFPAHVLLSWILSVARYSSDIPFAVLHIGGIPPAFVLICYLLVAILLRYHNFLAHTIARLFQVRAKPPLN